jgi:pimeloyl-ACP methyl ester carboxylesterase
VAWLSETLDSLHIDRCSLIGNSYGGWLALRYAADAPERVERLVLLSAGGLLPVSRQFALRGMLMVFVPTRFTVNFMMHWAGLKGDETRPLLDLMYLGLKHFRMPEETMRVLATPLSDDELRALGMPVLLLMGDGEVLCDPFKALARARRLIPQFHGEIVPDCRHECVSSQHRLVNARMHEFLEQARIDARGKRSAA